MTHKFVAPGGTEFRYAAGYAGDVHVGPGVDEPSVEIPVADLLAFAAHVVAQRRKGQAFTSEREDSN